MWIDRYYYAQQVQKHFSFLQEEYKMQVLANTCDECVKLKSSVSWIEIWFDRYSLYIYIGTIDGKYRTSLWDIMRFAVGQDTYSIYMATDKEKLEMGLLTLASYVKQYCDKALCGDYSFFEDVLHRKDKFESELMLENELGYIEGLAQTAWRSRDYEKIIELYVPIIEHLSPIQKKRLSICLKQLEQ